MHEGDVVVIEDDPNVLQMLLVSLRGAGFNAIGFSDPLDALMWVTEAHPACLIVDLKMPGVDGLDLVEACLSPGRHDLILISAQATIRTAVDATKLGAFDVIEKPFEAERLVQSVSRAMELRQPSLADEPTFTRRERQVAELIIAGHSTKAIARRLGISPRTVEFFRASLRRKTHSKTTAGLAIALARIGFIADPPPT